MKVIRVMLPWTSRPIMAWLTFTQPLQAWELWCLLPCVSVSASLCLSQRWISMSNRVSAHTTGLREHRDKSAFPAWDSSLHLLPCPFFYFLSKWYMKKKRRPWCRKFFLIFFYFLRNWQKWVDQKDSRIWTWIKGQAFLKRMRITRCWSFKLKSSFNEKCL